MLIKLFLILTYILYDKVDAVIGIGEFGKRINFQKLIVKNSTFPSLFSKKGYKLYNGGPCLFNSNLVTNTCPILAINYEKKLDLYDECVSRYADGFTSKYHTLNYSYLNSYLPNIYNDLVGDIFINNTIVVELYISNFPIWTRNKSGIYFYRHDKGKKYFGHAFNLYRSPFSNYYLLDNTWDMVLKLDNENLRNYLDYVIFYYIWNGRLIGDETLYFVITKLNKHFTNPFYYDSLAGILSYFKNESVDKSTILENIVSNKLKYITILPKLNISKNIDDIFSGVNIPVDTDPILFLY